MVSEKVKKIFNSVAREAFMPREVLEEMNAFDKCSPLARERGRTPGISGHGIGGWKNWQGWTKGKGGR